MTGQTHPSFLRPVKDLPCAAVTFFLLLLPNDIFSRYITFIDSSEADVDVVDYADASDVDRDVFDGGRAHVEEPDPVMVTSDDDSNDVGSSMIDDSSDTTSSASSTPSTQSRITRLTPVLGAVADGGLTPPHGDPSSPPPVHAEEPSAASSVPS